jgi:Bacterial SH3 domain
MFRHCLAMALASCLAPTWLSAQTTHTVRAEAVVVYKAPTTSSPVIGYAARGRALEVTADVGDWVQLVWPESPDRVGYVRVRQGSLPLGSLSDIRPTLALTPSAADAAPPRLPDNPPAADLTSNVPNEVASVDRRVTARSAVAYELPVHTIGVGARMDASTHAFGAAARMWPRDRFGAQIEMTRSTLTSGVSPARLTTFHISPSVLYALPNVVGSSIWLRPYVGGGAEMTRSTLRDMTPGMSAQDTSFGLRTFGGGEMTFAGLPQVTVSADVGYHWLESPFSAFQLGGLRASLSAHWYLK